MTGKKIVLCVLGFIVGLFAILQMHQPLDLQVKVNRLLFEIADRPSQKTKLIPGRTLDEIEADFDALGHHALGALEKHLESESPRIRVLALQQIARIGYCEKYDVIVSLFEEDDISVKYAAVEASGILKLKEAVPKLIFLLNCDDNGIRFRAAESLGRIGDLRDGEPIICQLDSNDLYVQAYAIQALGRLKYTKAVPRILMSLSNKDPWLVRLSVESLGLMGDESVVSALLNIATHEEERVRLSVEKALTLLGK